jgi:hypothetical protein
MRRLWLLAILPQLLLACSTAATSPPREMFDDHTGSTVTVVSKPWVFARERTDVAAHARDYATLVAVEVDHSGSYQDFLLLYRWSTVDKRMSPPPQTDGNELRLSSEGRVISLKPMDALPISIDAKHTLHLPRHGDAVVRAFAVDLDLLRFLAASHAVTLLVPQEQFDTPFQIWDDGREALGEFVRQTSAP